jgi:hypothetical protein
LRFRLIAVVFAHENETPAVDDKRKRRQFVPLPLSL